jgi:hypothetical protein
MNPEDLNIEADFIPLGTASVRSVALGLRPYLSVEVVDESTIKITVAGVPAGGVGDFTEAISEILGSLQANVEEIEE